MIKYPIVIISALILILALATPSLAFNPPNQGTDNATDVILWSGDNISLLVTTDSVTVEGLEGAMTKYLLLLVVALINAAAFWKRDSVFLKIIAVPVDIVYGLELTEGATIRSALWVSGVVIALIGMWFLFALVDEEVIGRIKKYVRRRREE